MRINLAIGSATLALTAGLLAACGGNGGSGASGSYCDELKSDKAYFQSLGGSNADMSNLDQMFARVHSLAKDAPANVSGDWKTLDDAITTIQSAFKEAGIKPSDLAAMQNGQVPQGVDISKLQALAPKLEALSSSDVSKAADNIAADAKKSCNLDLTSS
jgi:hypothetical protein